jgi:hypothetical protein
VAKLLADRDYWRSRCQVLDVDVLQAGVDRTAADAWFAERAADESDGDWSPWSKDGQQWRHYMRGSYLVPDDPQKLAMLIRTLHEDGFGACPHDILDEMASRVPVARSTP